MTAEAAADATSASTPAALPADNPFASDWTLPYGLPDFAAVRPEHILPAVRAGVAEQREILEQVASVAGPSFESVVLPLITGSALLTRVSRVYFHLMGADGTDELQALESEVSGMLAELADATYLDACLFAQVDAVLASSPELLEEDAHVLEQLHRRFVLRGARLDGTGRVWEVFDADGSGLGLFIGDCFTRDTKRGGAWMNSLQAASRRDGTKPVVANTMNVTPPAPGRPALVSFGEVRTMFHEFGHALHGLLSDVQNASVSGTAVPRDMVEFPSQVNEMRELHPGIIEHYARHVETDEVVPAALLEGIEASAQWGEGFATVEYLAAAVLDWRWHRLTSTEPVSDPKAFEAEQLAEAGLTHPLIAPRYRTGYFQHTFSGSYASGYYSYLWAEEFDADSAAWFEEQLADGMPLRDAGDAFRRGVLALGGSRDLLAAYIDFRGRDRDSRFLLERRRLL